MKTTIDLNTLRLVLLFHRVGKKRYAVTNRGFTGLEQWK